MRIVNIYGQEAWHMPARIIGTREGLRQFIATIEQAIDGREAASPPSGGGISTSDGAVYQITVECHEADWLDPGGFWQRPENDPEYLMVRIASQPPSAKAGGLSLPFPKGEE